MRKDAAVRRGGVGMRKSGHQRKSNGGSEARLQGWAIRLPGGHWVGDWAKHDPEILVWPTERSTNAFVWRVQNEGNPLREATRIASSVDGTIAEVWQFRTQRRFRSGDAIAPNGRRAIESESRLWAERVGKGQATWAPILVVP